MDTIYETENENVKVSISTEVTGSHVSAPAKREEPVKTPAQPVAAPKKESVETADQSSFYMYAAAGLGVGLAVVAYLLFRPAKVAVPKSR